ncbi:MAG: hypothetical protein AB7S26_24445 [Sandaracinaceae bacterium]
MPLLRVVAMALGLTTLALLQSSDGCGSLPPDEKGEGEPCTRTTECRFPLQCRGGVCMRDAFDAGSLDAGGTDAGSSDAGDPDASAGDGSVPGDAGDAGDGDAGDGDAGDAGDGDAGDSDAGSADAG